MKTKLQFFTIILIGLSLFAITGCSTAPKVTQTGFLSDYAKLGKDPQDFADKVYVNKNTVFKLYDKFMIDQVVFFTKDDAEYKGLAAEDLTEISTHFYNAIVDELSGAYTHTDKPGTGVMRLRVAITDLIPTNPVTSGITTVVPVGIVLTSAKRATSGAHVGMGGASFEAEILDSQTNELLAAAIDAETGKKYKVVKNFTKWAQVKGICDEWAGNLKKRLDTLSGRK